MDNFNPDKDPEKKNEKKFIKKVKKITERDGFYIILFICVCVVGVTAVWVSTDNFNKMAEIERNKDNEIVEKELEIEDYYIEEDDDLANQSNPNEEIVDIEDKDTPKEEKEVVQKTEDKPKEQPKEQKTSDNETIETSAQVGTRTVAMLTPIMGKVSMDYAEETLVYSKTLEQWTTHNGIDIASQKDSAVRVVLAGTVKEVKEDDILGLVITIDHGDGLVTKYGCLSTDEMVEVGQKVEKGDIISGIGEGVGFEMAQGPHLHFEVLQNGKNVNPSNYLPKID